MRFFQLASPGVEPWPNEPGKVAKDSVKPPFYSGGWAQESHLLLSCAGLKQPQQ